MSRKLKGLRKRGTRWQVFVKVAGKFRSATFPFSTPLETMRAWQETTIGQYGGGTAAGSFGADIETYLARVQAMTTINQRRAHLELWARELGRDRPRDSITDTEIDIVLQAWLDAGVANQTVRKRRTALQSFFVTMNGKGKLNPVKATHNPRPPKAEARSVDYLAIERLLNAMPMYQSVKKGSPPVLSLGRIRARVIAYTGLPPGLLMQVVPDDLSFATGELYVGGRDKGAGVEARTLPLTAEGLAAFKHFHAANAYGPFATAALNRSIKRAAVTAQITLKHFHLYDLRHSFLSEMYRVTGDQATVARFGLHAEGSPITARYTRGAHADVDRAAVAAFNAALAAKRQHALKPAITGTPNPKKVAKKVAKIG